MKRVVALSCAVCIALTAVAVTPAAAATAREPGGPMAFLIGCCFGIREGSEWNEGKDMHWREIAPVIPYLGLIFSIWNGIECAQGMTAHEWAEANGANWY